MKFTVTSLNRFILAGLLAAAGSAMAQAPAAAPPPPPPGQIAGHDGHGRMGGQQDPAKMQAWVAQHQAELKAKLKITTAQEAAWSRYTAAMQPPAHEAKSRQERAELDKLNTPERIDKMRALRTERMNEMNAAMDKRDEATKAFYASLNPEQKKIFDAERTRKHGPGKGGHPPEGGMQHKN
jgi:protein CpxP